VLTLLSESSAAKHSIFCTHVLGFDCGLSAFPLPFFKLGSKFVVDVRPVGGTFDDVLMDVVGIEGAVVGAILALLGKELFEVALALPDDVSLTFHICLN
jgi:hypothetical protein